MPMSFSLCGFVWTVVLSGGPVGMWEARREGRRGGIAILGAALIVYGWVFLLDIMLLVGVRRGKYCLATDEEPVTTAKVWCVHDVKCFLIY